MIVDWIYNNPTWLWGSILVAGTVRTVRILSFETVAIQALVCSR